MKKNTVEKVEKEKVEKNKITKTFQELNEADNLVGVLYKKDPTLRDTKFGYAYNRFYQKNFENLLKEFQKELELVRAEHALEDEKTKALILDDKNPRGFAYSKQGFKSVVEAEEKFLEKFNKKEVEIEPYFATFIPEDMNDYTREKLIGLVIRS